MIQKRITLSVITIFAGLQSFALSSYQATPINVAGYSWWQTNGLNNKGQVVGDAMTLGSGRAFIWTEGVSTLLPVDPRCTNSSVRAINDKGDSVGWMFYQGKTVPTLWSEGKWTELKTPDGWTNVMVHAINNKGQIVGSGYNSTTFSYGSLLWSEGSCKVFDFWEARGINDAGLVVGTKLTPAGYPLASSWDGSTYRWLGSLGKESTANAVNNAGTIVGYGFLWDGDSHAFISNGKPPMTDIGQYELFGGQSNASDINDSGIVVGNASSFLNGSYPFIWDGGYLTDLNDITTGLLDRVRYANGINNNGQIIVYGGEKNAYLLSPVPEPASILGLGSAIGMFLLRKRRTK